MKKFYITTTLPYVNSDPHIGFALEIVQADAIARYQKLQGKEVFFNTGTDEHGVKVFRTAQDKGKEVKAYCDERAANFKKLKEALNLSFDNFIRTTDEHHIMAAQEFWKKCQASGDIYKKEYKVKYCVGCELEKTDSELVEGKCSIHPNLEIETIEEENYFFKFSKYQKALLDLYQKNPEFVLPDVRMNEIKSFVERGLEDFSISRLKNKMPWGVPVPDDDEHVMYVWFDALVNYISAIGYPDDMGKMNDWWPGVQIAGKDNLRQQSAMWQAMLSSAGLPFSEKILIHGFIMSGGQKISKSAGNTVDPFDVVNRYGVDAVRYYLLKEILTFEDGNFTEERLKDSYNSGLANGLGNLVSRVLKMSEQYFPEGINFDKNEWEPVAEYHEHMKNYELNKAMGVVWNFISGLDNYVQNTKPFSVIKEDQAKAKEILSYLLSGLYQIANMLKPFMPETADKILASLEANKMPEPLFLRKE